MAGTSLLCTGTFGLPVELNPFLRRIPGVHFMAIAQTSQYQLGSFPGDVVVAGMQKFACGIQETLVRKNGYDIFVRYRRGNVWRLAGDCGLQGCQKIAARSKFEVAYLSGT